MLVDGMAVVMVGGMVGVLDVGMAVVLTNVMGGAALCVDSATNPVGLLQISHQIQSKLIEQPTAVLVAVVWYSVELGHSAGTKVSD